MSNEPDEGLAIRQPNGVIAINWVTYVHGVGISLRAAGVPATNPDEFKKWLDQEGLLCSHSLPAMWVFQAYFPEKHPGVIFTHVSVDMHEVSGILDDPRMIRFLGGDERAPLVPVDPVTKGSDATVAEFNNWIEFHLGLSERTDYTVLSDTSLDGLEDLLRQAAEEATPDH